MKKMMFVLLLIVSIGFLAAVESAPSAVVGYVKYPCVTGLNFIALPMNSGFAVASDMGLAYPGMMDAISYWDAVTQSWTTAVYYSDFDLWDPDFAVAPGGVYMINALSPFNLFSLGSMPASEASYGLLVGLNAIMVPLNKSNLTLASELGVDVGNLDAVSYWDASTQSWTTAVYYSDFDLWDPDFSVTIGAPFMVNSLTSHTWPVRGRSVSTFGSSNSLRK